MSDRDTLELLRLRKRAAESKGYAGAPIEEAAPEESGWFDPEDSRILQAISGVGESFAKPLYGALDLAGVDVDTSNSVLGGVLNKSNREEALETFTEQADQGSGVFGGAGRIAGDVSKYAIPGTAAFKAGAGAKTIFGAEVLGSGLIGGADTPEGSSSRAGNAAKEAALAAGGFGIGKVLEKAIKGANLKKGAQEYMDGGGYLTPGLAGEGNVIRGLESFGSVVPLISQHVDSARGAAQQGWGKKVLTDIGKAINPELTKDIPMGHEGMQILGKEVDSAYAKAWDAVDPALWKARGEPSFMKQLAELSADWGDTQASGSLKRLQRVITEGGGKRGGLKQVDARLRKMMGNAEGDFLDDLKDLKATLRQGGGDESVKQLTHIDGQYAKYLAVQDAAAKVNKGEFEAKGLGTSSRRVAGKRRASEGAGPLQQETEELEEILTPFGLGLLQSVGKINKVTPDLVPGKIAKNLGNATIGQTGLQKTIKAMLDEEKRLALRLLPAAGAAAIGDQ